MTTAAEMATRFDEHQTHAYDRLVASIKGALYDPRDADEEPRGAVMALLAAGGCGKTEVVLAALRAVIEHAAQREAERKRLEAQAQREQAAQAQPQADAAQARARAAYDAAMAAAMRGAADQQGAATAHRAAYMAEPFDGPFDGARFEGDDYVAPTKHKPETATQRKQREREEREAAEMAALQDITVGFADD